MARLSSHARRLTFASLFALVAASQPELKIKDGWINVPPPGARTAAAYFELVNDAKTPVVIKNVRVAGAASAEMHTMTQGPHGSAGMKRLADLTVAPGQGASFAPGGMHVMIFDPPAGMTPGQTVELTLELADGRHVVTQLTTRAP